MSQYYQYEPWYLRRSPPVFCFPCLPAYQGVYGVRRPVLVFGVFLFCIAFIILLGLLLTCVAVTCGPIVAALLPVALILLIIGFLLFHCGWAAHLLGEGGNIPVTAETVTQETTDIEEAKRRTAKEAMAHNLPEAQQGYWQFAERQGWQNACALYDSKSTHLPLYQPTAD